jgi:DNA-binding transcriptional ArsR family regulator
MCGRAKTGNFLVAFPDPPSYKGNRTVACFPMSMDAVFRALADPVRRRLLDRLHARNGQTLGELCEGQDMTRQAVSKHLAVLEQANLVATRKHGREKLHYLNPVPIHDIAERWIGKYERARLRALSDLRRRLEGGRE